LGIWRDSTLRHALESQYRRREVRRSNELIASAIATQADGMTESEAALLMRNALLTVMLAVAVREDSRCV
jgi:hypothetical protein